jgi:hypothetical protein
MSLNGQSPGGMAVGLAHKHMKKIIINTPIWKDRSVGIKKDIITEDIEVEIAYRDKFGNKVYPDILVMEKSKALSYPTKSFGNTPKLQIIPIADFNKKKEQNEDEKLKEFSEQCL